MTTEPAASRLHNSLVKHQGVEMKYASEAKGECDTEAQVGGTSAQVSEPGLPSVIDRATGLERDFADLRQAQSDS
jgi:hypothetical protein